MDNMIKVVVVEPQKEPYVKEIENSIDSFQKEVDGYYQESYCYKPLIIICDEDGKMKHKPYNRPITGDFFVGTFFITTSKQVNEDEVEYVSLTDEQIKYAKRLFTLDTEMSAMKSAKLQDLMKKLFPQIKKYPMNSMTPNISRDDDNKIVVSMLALADDEMIQDFVKDTDGKVDIEINCYLEKNKNNIGRDLVIRFNFYYPTGHPIFESVIYGDLLDRQKDFIEALMRVDNIMVWVVDKHHKVRKVIQTTWDYRPSAKLFNELLEG